MTGSINVSDAFVSSDMAFGVVQLLEFESHC